jgi:dTDP-4-dehydrorhamnose reductase
VAVHGIDTTCARLLRRERRYALEPARLIEAHPQFSHHEVDVRDRERLAAHVKELAPDLIVHAAAQPSHDLAASRPFDDFDVNAVAR